MKNRLQRAWALLRRDDGSNLVESAISCTVFFAMMFGICQVSYALYLYQYTSDAARQGSRWAMVRGATCHVNTPGVSTCSQTAGASIADIQDYVKGLNFPGVRTDQVVVTPTWCQASTVSSAAGLTTTWASCNSSTSHAPGNMVQVTVSYPIHIPWSTNPNLAIGTSSTMVISQ